MTRRRGSGEDSVYRDGDRWRGAVSLGYDEHGNRVRKKVSGRTRAEVTEKLRKLHQQVDSGVVPDDRLTVRAFLDRWLTVNLPGSVAESTEDDYVDTVRLHLVPALGRKPLAKLTVADLDRLWKAKRDAGYSSNSVRIMRTVLRRALGQAVREGIVARNVAGLSAAPRIRAKDGRTLTVDQARQLLEAAAGYRFEAAVVLALAYGMRRGEVVLLVIPGTAVLRVFALTAMDRVIPNFTTLAEALAQTAATANGHGRERDDGDAARAARGPSAGGVPAGFGQGPAPRPARRVRAERSPVSHAATRI